MVNYENISTLPFGLHNRWQNNNVENSAFLREINANIRAET